MMINVNRVGDNITGSVNGQQFGVTFDEQKYTLMKQLEEDSTKVEQMDEMKEIIEKFMPLTKESYKELVEAGNPNVYVNKHTNQYFLKWNDVISTKPFPQALVDKILTSIEKGIDILPLIKCWVRFLRQSPGRPPYSAAKANEFANYITQTYTNLDMVADLMSAHGLSLENATEKATTGQVAITQEGLIVGYKVSKEILTRYDLNENEEVVTKSRYTKSVDPDTGAITYSSPEFVEERLFEPCVMGQRGDEFWSGDKKGHFIRVGQSHWLENWNQVSTPGSKGLHCGGLSYIEGYQNEGTVTHNIFVDPSDIHSSNARGEGVNGAMTVKRYFVHSSFGGVNKNIYHSSTYAAFTDGEYQKVLEEVVKKGEESKAELNQQMDESLALAK